MDVREGNTGILYITGRTAKEGRYIPDYDLDKARELLLEFQELKDKNGRRLKDNYCKDGINWYPAAVSYLYWHVFFQYIKYRPLADGYIDAKADFKFKNKGNFYNLASIIKRRGIRSNFKQRIFFKLVEFNNRFVISRHPVSLLFFRFGPGDFRSAEIAEALDRLGAKYILVLPPSSMAFVLKNLFQKKPYYIFGGPCCRNIFNHDYDLNRVVSYKQVLFKRAIEKIEWIISGYVQEHKVHLQRLNNGKIMTLYGFDDANGYIFPILYACQDNGITTIAHQHGAGYVRRHAAYVMEGIEKDSYRWFDKVIVWGDYWKQRLLRISKVYSPQMFVVGSNKFSRRYLPARAVNPSPAAILIPYEFLANTYKVGLYMRKFMDMGYQIYFKPRADEKLEDQIEAYCLPEAYLKKLKIIKEIDNVAMEKIDIIAGTMTVLIYELLPCNKIMWILDTEYRHLEDLVEEGYAHKVRYEDLDNLSERYFKRTEVDGNYFFSPCTLEDTISKHVLQR